uniref:Toxin candidate TRINITY_DN36719_c0_g1_i1 n=1 Tax=Pachycerianthus maua TaxID=2736681 RepID=A0A7G7WZ18_9CNID|nr:toxin candidate TRINITY_DN36719_c0_g1_i1 [Pachycerianthus maua]
MTFVWSRDHFTLALSLTFLGVSCWAMPRKLCEVDRQTNGCSVPFGMEAPFKRQFIPACDKHDICYGCGHHYNWTREQCDQGFFEDMKSICKERSLPMSYPGQRSRRFFLEAALKLWHFFHIISKEEKRCNMMAKMYFKGVRFFGKSHYEIRDNDYCRGICADHHGNPTRRLDR